MMPSSKSTKAYARFIPSEEVGDVLQWKFGAVDGTPELPEEPEPPPPPTPQEIEAAHQQVLAQARAEAFALGDAQGRTQAGLEWQQRMDAYMAQEARAAAQRVDAIVQSLQQSLEQLQQSAAQGVLELACETARQVLRQELRDQPQALLPVVREALGMLAADSGLATVRLNPQDHAMLADALRQELAAQQVQWLPDDSVALGGCRVEQGGVVIDGSLEKRWQRAIAPLGLAVPWEAGQQTTGDDHGDDA